MSYVNNLNGPILIKGNGNITGNLTGNVVATTLSGALTGNVVATTLSGALTGNVTGNVVVSSYLNFTGSSNVMSLAQWEKLFTL